MSQGHGEHHIGLPTYIKVFVALICLTIITVAASRVDFGEGNTIIAFAIATIKALLVLAYFMHLKYDNMLNRAFIVAGFFFLLVLFFFVKIDDITRIVHKAFV